MKTALLVTLILLALTALPAAAQYITENLFTINPDPYSTAYDFDCRYTAENQTQVWTLFLFDPVNFDFDGGQVRPVTQVGGFECRVLATEGVNILNWTFPVPSINVGQGPDLVVGFSEPVPVVDRQVALATCEIFFGAASFELPEAPIPRCTNHANAFVHITPTLRQSIPGLVAYLDADDPQNNLVAGACSGPLDPDFKFQLIQEEPVDVEGRTWGTLKALYR